MNIKVVAVAPHVISAKSMKCITVAAEATRYYYQVGWDIMPTNMHCKELTNFNIQWNALKDLKKQDDPDVTKLTNNGSIIKCIESFTLHLNAIVGVQNCSLVYVVREQHDLSRVTCGTILSDQLHSKEHGLAEVDMIRLTSYDHPLFRNDNGDVYDRMEQALSGSQYAPMIVRLCKKREGNKAFRALVAQHSGKPVWEKRIKDDELYMMNRKWTRIIQQMLEKHINRHRSAFVCLSKATDHVSQKIPNKRTRVGYVVGIIDSKDANVLSTLAEIRKDDMGMCENFDLDAIFLVPTCLVAKKHGNKKVEFDTTISATDGKQSGQGKTGVEIRYHEKHEVLALLQYHKDELFAYNATTDGGKWKGAAGNPV